MLSQIRCPKLILEELDARAQSTVKYSSLAIIQGRLAMPCQNNPHGRGMVSCSYPGAARLNPVRPNAKNSEMRNLYEADRTRVPTKLVSSRRPSVPLPTTISTTR